MGKKVFREDEKTTLKNIEYNNIRGRCPANKGRLYNVKTITPHG